MKAFKLNTPEVNKIIDLALTEDIKDGDITTDSIIAGDAETAARIIVKEEAVIAGLPIAEMVFKKLDTGIKWDKNSNEGKLLTPNSEVIRFSGSHRAILTGERTALNFLQRMSGIATTTRRYVKKIENTRTKILDTRKTLPGHRYLDKYSVLTGGGMNHRFGLYDMVMIKDNHIRIAGGIKKAVDLIRRNLRYNIKIEVEASNLTEVEEAVKAGVDIIMLDNMDLETTREAVKMIEGKSKIEASGNMTLDRIGDIAGLGVDFISIGALTHSVKGVDLSLEIIG